VKELSFCFPTTFYPPFHFGGDAVSVQRMARALVRRGHRVTVVHDLDAFSALGGKASAPAVRDDDGVEVIGLTSGLGRLSPLMTQQLGRPVGNQNSLRRIVSDSRFDVINYHNISLIGGPVLLGFTSRAVKLYTALELWLVCPTHVLWRHNREPCPARQCLRCQLVYRRPPQLWRLTGLLERNLQHVHAFIAFTEFSRLKHKEFGFPRDMTVIPGMVPDPPSELTDGADRVRSAAEEELASSQAHGKPQSAMRPYFLFVGRLERLKGLQDVIPLFRSYGDADLVVIGDGSYRSELERLAGGLSSVRFLGTMESTDVSRFYAGAVATIVPSATFESFGIVVAESLAHRTPVIARDLGPLPELIRQSNGGLLFSTPAQLMEAMRRMQSDAEFREACADSGYMAFRERWSENAVIPRYLDLVQEHLENGRAVQGTMSSQSLVAR
jgi:glycosyltransferase involved in cell wall biosynthesis